MVITILEGCDNNGMMDAIEFIKRGAKIGKLRS